MKHAGTYGTRGLLDPQSMTVMNRSSSGETTQITYQFPVDTRTPGDIVSGDRLVGLTFSVDPTDPVEQSLGGITKVGLKKDGAFYVATITLSKNSTTPSVDDLPRPTSVDNLPPPTSSTLTSYNVNVVGGTAPNGNFGSNGNDVLIGGEGNDRLKAYGGKKEEVDILTGGAGADTFVLGGLNAQGQSNFGDSYQGSGHAIITDFNEFDEDKIQLLKNSNYQLKFEDKHIGSAATKDTTIYYKGDIIAYVQDVKLDNLSSTSFTFV